MSKENFLSSWLREDGREKEERPVKFSNENEEERGKKRRGEAVSVKRKCEGFLSVKAFEIRERSGELW